MASMSSSAGGIHDDLMTVPVPGTRTEPATASDTNLEDDSHPSALHSVSINDQTKLPKTPHEHDDATSAFSLAQCEVDDSHYRFSNQRTSSITSDEFSINNTASANSNAHTLERCDPHSSLDNATSLHEFVEDSNENREISKRSRCLSRGNTKKGENSMMLPSYIWNYFIKDSTGKFVICTLCSDQSTRFAYSGGTSTMNRHLRKKHQKYAPGKSAADYEKSSRSGGSSRRSTSASMAYNGVLDVTTLAGLPVNDVMSHRQLLEWRQARHNNYLVGNPFPKRKKLYPGLSFIDTSDNSIGANTALPIPPEFDASSFGNIPTAPGQHIFASQGLEFADAANIELATSNQACYNINGQQNVLTSPNRFMYTAAGANSYGPYQPGAGPADPRIIDYTSLVNGPYVQRNRLQHSISSQKLLSHRVLRYLIAQYEPLNLSSRMQSELQMLLFGSDYMYPSISLPTEESLKLALANLYCSQREILNEVIASVDVLSLSLNEWASIFGQNVLTVTAHWISANFKRRDCILEVYILPLEENVSTIALLHDVRCKWSIPASKLVGLTMADQASRDTDHTDITLQNALHVQYPALCLVKCFTQILNNAMETGLLKCNQLIHRCRNYVSYFIQNPSEYQIFLQLRTASTQNESEPCRSGRDVAQTAADNHEEDLKSMEAPSSGKSASSAFDITDSLILPAPVLCDSDNQWKATIEMMVRIVELEPYLLTYKHHLQDDSNGSRRPMQIRFACCEISSDDWKDLKKLVRVLQPLGTIVNLFDKRTDYYPGLSIIYPIQHSIREHLSAEMPSDSDSLTAIVTKTIAACIKQVDPCQSGSSSTSSPYLACLLDPRFKHLRFLESDDKDRIIGVLRALQMELFSEHEQSSEIERDGQECMEDGASGGFSHDFDSVKRECSSAQAIKNEAMEESGTSLLQELFQNKSSSNMESNEVLEQQLMKYLDSPELFSKEDAENDPLEWWNRYQRLFPWLAKLARRYLCISAVSVPFDEAFTNIGQLMREKKARLDIEVAAQMLFCRSASQIPEIERLNLSRI